MREIAKQFWTRADYPKYGTIKQRRLHEFNYLYPYLKDAQSVLDLGCGDGALVEILRHLIDAKLTACDLSEPFIEDIHPDIKSFVYDSYEPTELPTADVTIWAGAIPFLFEDEVVIEQLKYINSPKLLVRCPCAEEDTYINKHSEELKEQYSSRYRTTMHITSLLETKYKVEKIERIYPDDIESKFGTKQYYFVCQKLTD